MRILRHPWILRAWIFQEVALANFHQFLIGTVIVPFESFLFLAQVMEHLWGTAGPRNTSQELEQTIAGAFQIYHMARVILERANRQPHTNFCNILSLISPNIQCSNPSDLALALRRLLGVPVSTSSLSSLSTKEVFIETVPENFRTTQNLDILSVINRHQTQRPPMPGLPSWVPDWRLPEDTLQALTLY